MLPRLAVRCHCLRVAVYRPVLHGLAHRARTAQRRSHTAKTVFLRLFPPAAVPRLLGGDAAVVARLATRRGGLSRARGAGRHQRAPRTVQGDGHPPFRVAVRRRRRHRPAPRSRAALHVRQRHPGAHARHDARVLRDPAAPHARAALPGHARQPGGQRVGRRAAHGRRHQPRASGLRGGRVRADGSERRAHAGLRGDRERADVVVPRSRHGHHHHVVDGQDRLDADEGCLPTPPSNDADRRRYGDAGRERGRKPGSVLRMIRWNSCDSDVSMWSCDQPDDPSRNYAAIIPHW